MFPKDFVWGVAASAYQIYAGMPILEPALSRRAIPQVYLCDRKWHGLS